MRPASRRSFSVALSLNDPCMKPEPEWCTSVLCSLLSARYEIKRVSWIWLLLEQRSRCPDLVAIVRKAFGPGHLLHARAARKARFTSGGRRNHDGVNGR